MRILAADDDRVTRRLLAVNLERWGYEPVLAADGLEAWEILQSEDAPEIVVLDWVMPGMDGIEVCRALRSQTDRPYRYVLLLAPKVQKNDVIAAFEAGADDYIAKPINLTDFEDRLTAAARGLATRRKYGIAATRPGEGFEALNEVTKVEPESPSQATLANKIVGGKYKVLRPIASGGMGTVWEGLHTTLGTRVAIKFIRPEYTKDTDSMSRFETEARVMARLQSRYAVHVYDYGVTPGGLPYLVMEYLEGRSLTDVIEKDGALTPQGVATVISQAAQALERAHKVGVIHRDVKPDNIMLIPDDDAAEGDAPWHVKLVDFGVAKVLLETSVPIEVEAGLTPSPLRRPTARGVLLGTPAFMSPEQLLASGVADKHTDLWGLAACAFVAMTAKLPYSATSLGDLVKQVCLNPPPVPSSLNPAAPPAFDAWFAKACASNIADRFQSGSELARELQAACGVARPSLIASAPTPLPSESYAPPRSPPPARASWGPGSPTPVRGVETRARSGFTPAPPRAPGIATVTPGGSRAASIPGEEAGERTSPSPPRHGAFFGPPRASDPDRTVPAAALRGRTPPPASTPAPAARPVEDASARPVEAPKELARVGLQRSIPPKANADVVVRSLRPPPASVQVVRGRASAREVVLRAALVFALCALAFMLGSRFHA
jgi:serine/threonine protein kinase/FixJ family two-component response regulator